MNLITDVRKPMVDAFIALALGYAMASENVVFEAPAGLPYIEIHFMPATSYPVTLGDNGIDETDGIIQFDLNWIYGVGEAEQFVAIASIVNLFKIGKQFVINGVTTQIKSVNYIPGRKVDNYWRIGISVTWNSFSNR